MNIAIVHNLPAGGQKRALFEQVKRLSKKHTFDLYSLSTANETFLPILPYIRRHFISKFEPPQKFPGNVLSLYFSLPQVYKKMAKHIDNNKYDVVYVQPDFFTQAPYVLQYLKTKSVYFCPEPKREFYEFIPRKSNTLTYSFTYPFRIPLKWIDQKNTKLASILITNSKYSQIQIKKVYGRDAKLNYLGVDTNFFKPITEKQTNTVISVGDFSLLKGHDFIINSLSLIEEDQRPELVIVGNEGVEKSYLLKLAKDKGITVHIHENISVKELVGLYNSAKAFVYAAQKEPFGLVLLEALACGLPILAVSDGGVVEVLKEKKMGILVERNEKIFAEKLKEIIDSKISVNEKKEKNRLVQKEWNWEKSIQQLEKFLYL